MVIVDKDSESWSLLIEKILEKIKIGILRGTWSYSYNLEIDDEISRSYYSGEAIRKAIRVYFWVEVLCGSSIISYIFEVESEKINILSLQGDPMKVDAPSTVLRKYWDILKDVYEQAKALSALENIDELPE